MLFTVIKGMKKIRSGIAICSGTRPAAIFFPPQRWNDEPNTGNQIACWQRARRPNNEAASRRELRRRSLSRLGTRN